EFTMLGILLLRGAQTPGELKQRSERWHQFRSLDDVEAALQQLAERGFVRRLERRPGQKEARWVTLVVASADLDGAVDGDAFVDEVPVASSPAPVTEALPASPPEERSLEVHNPATGEHLRSVAITDEREVEQKVERARRAQKAWATRSYAERAALIRAFRDLLDAEIEECARTTTREMGKHISQS